MKLCSSDPILQSLSCRFEDPGQKQHFLDRFLLKVEILDRKIRQGETAESEALALLPGPDWEAWTFIAPQQTSCQVVVSKLCKTPCLGGRGGSEPCRCSGPWCSRRLHRWSPSLQLQPGMMLKLPVCWRRSRVRRRFPTTPQPALASCRPKVDVKVCFVFTVLLGSKSRHAFR